MPKHNIDETLSVADAVRNIQDACYYANDNAGIESAILQPDGSLAVAMYHGCNLTEMGRLQYFKVTVERITTSTLEDPCRSKS